MADLGNLTSVSRAGRSRTTGDYDRNAVIAAETRSAIPDTAA
jgi:hypothetical protein